MVSPEKQEQGSSGSQQGISTQFSRRPLRPQLQTSWQPDGPERLLCSSAPWWPHSYLHMWTHELWEAAGCPQKGFFTVALPCAPLWLTEVSLQRDAALGVVDGRQQLTDPLWSLSFVETLPVPALSQDVQAVGPEDRKE
ncbi:hypothetical protein EYF80_063649 [Liparis tanakae]|uniref:Uncharacterized protein n=1 Tax=Liparis tanakae TaxID=230148 RepID=A0A4Z2ECF4_9TELE|nr:hypothetical protein EYF80_063649 [Liparis tanakae]